MCIHRRCQTNGRLGNDGPFFRLGDARNCRDQLWGGVRYRKKCDITSRKHSLTTNRGSVLRETDNSDRPMPRSTAPLQRHQSHQRQKFMQQAEVRVDARP